MAVFVITPDALHQTDDAWPGWPCCQELRVGSVACTQLLKSSVKGVTVTFAAWRGRTVAWRFPDTGAVTAEVRPLCSRASGP